MKKSDLVFNAVRLPFDFVLLFAAGITNYLLRTKIVSFFRPVYFEFNLSFSQYCYLLLIVSFIFLASYAVSGLYSMKNKISRIEELLKIIVASSAGIMMVIIYIFLRQELFNSRFLVLGGWFFSIVFVFVGRLMVRKFEAYSLRRFNFGSHKTMLIGQNSAAILILEQMKGDQLSGRIVKHLLNPEIDEVTSAVGNPGIEEVILADSNYPSHKVLELIDFCNDNHLTFKFVPNVYHSLSSNFEVTNIRGLPLIELKRTSLDGWGRILKRLFDVFAALLSLIILSPLFLILAFAIKWETEGPVFARLKRVSRNSEFILYKFRSMVDNAHEFNEYLRSITNDRLEAGPLWKLKNDPRITKVGKLIRKTRIDEFAQLWNVLKGDMSLVGPRPHQPDEIARYEKHHKKVLAIKAGATGLAQVSGSSDLPFEQEVVLDSFYIDNWSLLLDIKIILKTVFKVLNDRSAV